jgi:hypothetical protein
MHLDNEKRNCENSAKHFVAVQKEFITNQQKLADIEFKKLVFLNNIYLLFIN